MNFLAHLHIAQHCKSDLAGNLLGDFVKGDPCKSYPKDVAKGIKLHRFVDIFTDNHNAMKCGKRYFPDELRRFAPIALDLFWDHCLARHWSDYHHQTLAQFCLYAESETSHLNYTVPDKFLQINTKVWQGKWLESYERFSNLEHALYRMSLRSERMGKLASCFESLDKHYDNLNTLFPYLYQDVLAAAKVHSHQM